MKKLTLPRWLRSFVASVGILRQGPRPGTVRNERVLLKDGAGVPVGRVKAKKLARARLPDAAARAREAAACFPNHFGNYAGKRTPKPEVPALSARERGRRLLALFLERARSRPEHREGIHPLGRWYWAEDPARDERFVRVGACTRSEARAAVKRELGLRTTRGLNVLAA
jgi:hypothetical protein